MPHERDALLGASFGSIVQHVRDVITVVDADGRVRFVNDATRQVLGHDAATPAGTTALEWVHPDDRELALERRRWLLEEPGRTSTTILRVRQGAGSWRHVETHGVNLLHDPLVRGLLYVSRDVEDRARNEQALVHALGAQRVVAEVGLRALRSQDVGNVLLEGLERAAGLIPAPYVTLLLLGDDASLEVRQQVGPQALPPGHPWPSGSGTHEGLTLALRQPVRIDDLRRHDVVQPTAEQAFRGVVAGLAVPLEGSDGPIGVLAVHTTEPHVFSAVDVQFLEGLANVLAGALVREQREQTALVQALHDPLTGLPTRPLFDDRLEHALARTRRGGEVAVLLVDLDRFKSVNDVFGHPAGDEVLRAMGPRLAACARSSDTVARYGGDEFVVLCEDDVTHVGVARVAASIRRACSEPVVLSVGESVLLSCSVGTAWSVEQGADAAALLSAADAAMYADKRAGSPA